MHSKNTYTSQSGQALVEYSFLAAIIGVAAMFGLLQLSSGISSYYDTQTEELYAAATRAATGPVEENDTSSYDCGDGNELVDLPVAVTNGSFEAEDIDTSSHIIRRTFRYPNQTEVAVNMDHADITAWSTTASDRRIEIWESGFAGVNSFSGSQHAEINANRFGALYQDISTTPGSVMRWQFAHRGRSGPDTIELNIGAPDGDLVTVETMTTDRNAWILYSGEYLVPEGQTETRFEYQAVATANNSISVGNFLDDIRFFVQSDSPFCD